MKPSKRPKVSEAMQWTGGNTTSVLKWMFPNLPPDTEAVPETSKAIREATGAQVGAWIIKGTDGFHSCTPNKFTPKYCGEWLPRRTDVPSRKEPFVTIFKDGKMEHDVPNRSMKLEGDTLWLKLYPMPPLPHAILARANTIGGEGL